MSQWRKKWSGVQKTKSFPDAESYQRAWRSANAWYRLTGRFSLFTGWMEKLLSALADVVRKYKRRGK